MLGASLAWTPKQGLSLAPLPEVHFAQVFNPRPPAGSPLEQELRLRFEQGVVMLHMRQHEYALASFQRVLSIVPDMPEAHVNIGFALIGLEEWLAAHDFFLSAIDLDRNQINAYYGLAVALEALGDVPGALGAMQAYVHRSPEDDPYRARAMSALWEWQEAAMRDAAAADGESESETPGVGESEAPGGGEME